MAGNDFFREREKAVSGTEWDDLHKAGWAKSHDGRSLGRGSRGGRPLLLPTHTWKKGRECRLPPHKPQGIPPLPSGLLLSCLGLLSTLSGSQNVLCDNRIRCTRRKQQGKEIPAGPILSQHPWARLPSHASVNNASPWSSVLLCTSIPSPKSPRTCPCHQIRSSYPCWGL